MRCHARSAVSCSITRVLSSLSIDRARGVDIGKGPDATDRTGVRAERERITRRLARTGNLVETASELGLELVLLIRLTSVQPEAVMDAVFGLMAIAVTITSPDCVPAGLPIVSELEEEVSFEVAARKVGAEVGVALTSFE